MSCGFTLSAMPLLDALANYGGPTKTRALLVGSPAIDAGPAICYADRDGDGLIETAITEDQRGLPIGPICDLGAYEF